MYGTEVSSRVLLPKFNGPCLTFFVEVQRNKQVLCQHCNELLTELRVPGHQTTPSTFKNAMSLSNKMKSIIALICLLSFTRAEISFRSLRNVDNHRDLSQDKLSQELTQEPVSRRTTEQELRSYRGRNLDKKGWDPVYEEDGKKRRRKGNKKPKHKGPKKAEKVEECDDHGDKKNPRDCHQGRERCKVSNAFTCLYRVHLSHPSHWTCLFHTSSS